MAYFQNFLAQYEGVKALPDNDNDTTETEQFLLEMEFGDKDEDCDHFFTEYGKVDGAQIVLVFNNQSVFYAIIKVDIFNESKESSVFTFDDRYSATTF